MDMDTKATVPKLWYRVDLTKAEEMAMFALMPMSLLWTR
jgi:hypothetical protein